jgi:3-hydroxyacyl-[acyl-carrier-protein] dehydratase
VAERPSHAGNVDFAKAILEHVRRSGAPIADIARIMEFLPHRYPFLLIDRVLSMELESERKLTGLKNVTINEPFFQGHFPDNPVMPGVLIIEAMAQAAGMLAHLSAAAEGKEGGLFYLVKVDKAKFNRTVIPGDQLILEAVEKRVMRGLGQYECKAWVDGKRAASCEILCAAKKA